MVRRVPLIPKSFRWLAVLAVAGGIIAASVTRSAAVGRVTGPLGILGLDKYLHALAYAVLASVLAYALAEWDPRPAAVTVFLVAVAFGLFVELVQLPLSYRQFSGFDLVANAAGASVVAISWSPLVARVCFRRVAATDAKPGEADP